MITRSNLAEQLREYQIRSKNDWASFSFFSSTANIPSRADVVISVLLELWIFALLIFSGISLYLRYMRVAFLLICAATLLFVFMRVVKRVRQNRKSKRRMLLPLSM
ncbi:unnamed protein product [Spirodela intermedia]|uniref:Uncharacterized protein n=2 Tax=Spirodela intermedia TaxID=51605 RepID=A0A7I8JTN9_SPIIN|nr:unnamed protein product [Spirodela intermedia]CAA6673538.1 unnamed protein product [Spirodela intermedia]CAA7410774.1 unnamed protein product [Spirodela intermedia]